MLFRGFQVCLDLNVTIPGKWTIISTFDSWILNISCKFQLEPLCGISLSRSFRISTQPTSSPTFAKLESHLSAKIFLVSLQLQIVEFCPLQPKLLSMFHKYKKLVWFLQFFYTLLLLNRTTLQVWLLDLPVPIPTTQMQTTICSRSPDVLNFYLIIWLNQVSLTHKNEPAEKKLEIVLADFKVSFGLRSDENLIWIASETFRAQNNSFYYSGPPSVSGNMGSMLACFLFFYHLNQDQLKVWPWQFMRGSPRMKNLDKCIQDWLLDEIKWEVCIYKDLVIYW